ncbi:DUF2480 family protein [Flavobacterium sp.]|uniref:DUF2480 family protein n=1 Tax=Flavobacterium sp. TaxID=239 RepID=UPI002B4AD984|nr:DUF2480 family protein [Flavobacterium sp.]HLF51181.1 DUF2480 family protein [Flavobacterium sp.]
MRFENEITNKVAQSGIIEINLEDFFPQNEKVLYDLKSNLYEELVLKEKDFREFVKNNNWKIYEGKSVALYCSADAIVPTWAYMLLTSALEQFAKKIVFGDLKTLENILWMESLSKINPENFRDARVVIKGCSDKISIPECAYVEITRLLKPVAKSIMYGEPCSTVPVFKRKESSGDN